MSQRTLDFPDQLVNICFFGSGFENQDHKVDLDTYFLYTIPNHLEHSDESV